VTGPAGSRPDAPDPRPEALGPRPEIGEPHAQGARGPTAEEFRLIVSRVLIGGVGASAVLVALGFFAALAVGWQGSLLGAPPGGSAPTDFAGWPAGLLAMRPEAIAQLGLLVLIATPVLRVATSVVVFFLEGDRLYTVVTLVVLGILLASLLVLR
jgi:uncharacterized membrane protein